MCILTPQGRRLKKTFIKTKKKDLREGYSLMEINRSFKQFSSEHKDIFLSFLFFFLFRISVIHFSGQSTFDGEIVGELYLRKKKEAFFLVVALVSVCCSCYYFSFLFVCLFCFFIPASFYLVFFP